MLLSAKPLQDVFFCPEESDFYSHCLDLVLNDCERSESIIEFGSGDGSPVIRSLLRAEFDGVVHGFEINSLACEAARLKIEKHSLKHKYIIHNRSFLIHLDLRQNILYQTRRTCQRWTTKFINLYFMEV